MSDLKSVICFTGGAGGDFLKALCLTQFSNQSFMINDTGMIDFDNHYFKRKCEQCYKDPLSWNTINQCKIKPVDNTHYYFDWFTDIFSKIYYIDYPDDVVDVIVNTYITKRYQGNKENFIKTTLSRMPQELQNIIPRSNALVAIGKTWLRNQHTWRNNSNMHAIQLLDLFDITIMKKIIPEMIQKDFVDFKNFEQLHLAWTVKNQNLLQTL